MRGNQVAINNSFHPECGIRSRVTSQLTFFNLYPFIRCMYVCTYVGFSYSWLWWCCDISSHFHSLILSQLPYILMLHHFSNVLTPLLSSRQVRTKKKKKKEDVILHNSTVQHTTINCSGRQCMFMTQFS